jgi:hypothetical protein
VACVASEKPPRLFTRYTSFSRQILLREMFNRIHATLDDSKDHKLGRRPLCCALDTDPFGTSQQSRDAQFGLSATADDMGMTVNRLKRSQSPWRLHSSGQESEHHARLPWSTRTSILSLVPILSIRHCDNENPLMIWARDSTPGRLVETANGVLPLHTSMHRSPISLRRTYFTERGQHDSHPLVTLLFISAHS